jgi:hypothetical protein
MKFADKYELFDAVTTGRLEAFLGRDVASGERVLVHIFEAPVKKADQPTVQWVLESFRAIAPEPPGLVIAAGRYGSTSYAYLVTQVPDDAALRKWTQAYESSTAETREIPVERTISPEPPAVSTLARPNVGEAGPASISQSANPLTGFFGLRPPAETGASPPKEAVKLPGASTEAPGNDLEGISFGPRQDAARQEPGDFTKQFFAGSNEPPRPPVDEIPVRPAAQRMDRIESSAETTGSTGPSVSPVDGAPPDPRGFTALFRPSLKPEIPEIKDSPKRIDAARKADDGKAGDFTKFFQGPFDGERPAEIPDVLPNASSTPRGKVPGEFTQIFGSGKDNPFAAMSSSAGPIEEPPLRTEPGSFTRSFADAAQLSPTAEPPLPIGETKGNGSQKAPTFAEPKWTEPVPSPVEAPVKPPDPPGVPRVSVGPTRSSVQGGATQLFSVPGGHSAPGLPPPPSGPSEYTRIISGGMAGLISSEEKPVAEEGPAAAGGLPAFKMPAPAVPPAPKIAAPPAPKLPVAPPAPKIPPLGGLAPKPKASYLPMIIILNVSLIIAVLLIVYFAIKH